MARRRRTTKKGKGYGKRTTLLLLNVGANVLASKGLNYLEKQKIMDVKPKDDGTMPKVNAKKLLLEGSAFATGSASAILIDNDYAFAALSGLASAGANGAVTQLSPLFKKDDEAEAPADGSVAGLGRNRFTDLYMDESLSGDAQEDLQFKGVDDFEFA